MIATIPEDFILTANNTGITILDFVKSFIGPLPLGFDWVYIVVLLVIVLIPLIWFFNILDIKYWFKY